ncbi:MAG: hypothetical protein ACP5I1_18250, partial [Candidatus Hinthialibacter sp.]
IFPVTIIALIIELIVMAPSMPSSPYDTKERRKDFKNLLFFFFSLFLFAQIKSNTRTKLRERSKNSF